ncbi:MAG: hypothetical protein HY929_01995 [Euryarchaeota archaeon]|nr:hypothetical protein [Euryarchaeota archaeon]
MKKFSSYLVLILAIVFVSFFVAYLVYDKYSKPAPYEKRPMDKVSVEFLNSLNPDVFGKAITWCTETYNASAESFGFDAEICGSKAAFVAKYWSGVLRTQELVKDKDGRIVQVICHDEYRVLPNAFYHGYFIEAERPWQIIAGAFEARNGIQPNMPKPGEGEFNITRYFVRPNEQYTWEHKCYGATSKNKIYPSTINGQEVYQY